ncbi:MAG TPA: hypothetical protein VHP58_04580 [Alphaproteobacteria bacterium]|nr:hypothetical protein [Alphaproteobacteria bacterium]
MKHNLAPKLTLGALAVVSALALSACGESVADRSISGAGIGAGVGAGAAALTGGNPWTGAIVGGAVGGVGGAATAPRYRHYDGY